MPEGIHAYHAYTVQRVYTYNSVCEGIVSTIKAIVLVCAAALTFKLESCLSWGKTRQEIVFLQTHISSKMQLSFFLQTCPGSSILTSSLWAVAPCLLWSCSYHHSGVETYVEVKNIYIYLKRFPGES